MGAEGQSGGKASRKLYSAAPPDGLSGGPVCALDHLRALKPAFDGTCLVLCEQSPLADRAQAADVPVWCSPFTRLGLRQGGLRRFIRGIVPVVRSRWGYLAGLHRMLKQEPGILHVHSRAMHLPYALLAGRWARVPVVVTIHEPWTGGWEAWFQLCMIRWLARRVVFLTEVMKRQHPRFLGKLAEVVYNHCPLAPEKMSAPANARPRVVLAARMTRAKGTDVFLQTCRRLNGEGARFEAWMVGPWPRPDERAAAEDYIRQNGLANVVRLLGLQEEMSPVYEQTDVLLLPTRRDSFPRVVMEAMCRGIPVVATRVDGIPEMVEDGVTGFLVPAEDVDGFAAAAKRLLANEPLRRQMGAAGRERAKELFSPDIYRERMMAIYGKLEQGP